MMIHKNSHHRQSLYCFCYDIKKCIVFIRIRSLCHIRSSSSLLFLLLILLHIWYQYYQNNSYYYDIFVHQRQIIVQQQLHLQQQAPKPNNDEHYRNINYDNDSSNDNNQTNKTATTTITTPQSLRQGIASFITRTTTTLNEQQHHYNSHHDHDDHYDDRFHDDKNHTTTTLFWILWEQYHFRYSSYYNNYDDLNKENDAKTDRIMTMAINRDITMNVPDATTANVTNTTSIPVKRKRKQIVWYIPNYNLICNTKLGFGIEGYGGYQLLANKIRIYYHDLEYDKDDNVNSNQQNQNSNSVDEMQKRSYRITNISTITSTTTTNNTLSSSVVIDSTTNTSIHNTNYDHSNDLTLNNRSLSYSNIRLFCGIYTHSTMYELARTSALTWGKDCHGFISFTNESNVNELGFIQLHDHMNESYYNMWQKTRCILKYIYEHYINDYDYFHIGGDDMYVIVPNLLYFLSNIPNALQQQPLMFGQWIRQKNNPYISGGPGYTLNKYSIIYFMKNQYHICYPNDIVSYEDRLLSYCLSKYIYDSRDPNTSEQLYHDVAPDQIYTSRPNDNKNANIKRRNRENFHTKLLRYYETLPYHNYYQYYNNGYHYPYNNDTNNTNITKLVGPKYGLDAASQYSISFHRLYNPEYMMRIHSILYPNEICFKSNSTNIVFGR